MIDPDADIILVRTSCGPAGAELPNCFEYLGHPGGQVIPQEKAAEYWINEMRTPTASTPLLVDIGPGSFLGMAVSCPSDSFANGSLGQKVEGHITFRGAGQGTTEIAGNGGTISVLLGTFLISGGCAEMSFQDMTIREVPTAVAVFLGPVVWSGAGNSKWTNVELISNTSRLWYDRCDSPSDVPEHYFFSSKLTMNLTSSDQEAVRVECGRLWFFGSEISVFGTNLMDDSVASSVFAPFHMTDTSLSIQLFGSLVRSVQGAANAAITGGTVYGVKIENGGSFHMHGGNMRVSSSGNTHAVAIDAGIAGSVHTPDTAFVVEVDSGTLATASRLAGNPANIKSPFLWQSGPFPPQASSETNAILSIDGKDMFVETDCSTVTGSCDNAGSDPHLMIYSDTACDESNPWFDVVMGACRPPQP